MSSKIENSGGKSNNTVGMSQETCENACCGHRIVDVLHKLKKLDNNGSLNFLLSFMLFYISFLNNGISSSTMILPPRFYPVFHVCH